MELDLRLTRSSALVTGTVYQFVEGSWPGPMGGGVVLSEAAFDFVLPLIQHAWPDWDEMAKYGVTKISPQSCTALAAELRGAAERTLETGEPPEWAGYSDRFTPELIRREFNEHPARLAELAGLFEELASWLEEAIGRVGRLSLLGI